MSVFSKILGKLGLGKDKPAAAATAAAPAKPAGTTADAKPVAKPTAPASMPQPGFAGPSGPAAAPKPAAISEVDVVKKLEALGSGKGLNWKVSIVDLLTLLEIDSSRESRNELAKELGCPPELMGDSAKMNTWLHKTVLKKIAENGGNIPKELLD
ncbi:MAG: DUF3597 domain-containing protein [Anaerolineales bacterium]|nr:DUF3597 domain-containing protein [Anaerolineales bacterium]